MKAITQLELEVIGKLRRDADLRYVYDGPQKPRGAPRKYDGKVVFDDLSRWQTLGEVKPNVSLYTAVVWSVNLKRKIRVVYLLNQPSPDRSYTALLFSTDLELDPTQLYEAYRARFQIEFIFRDAKQFTGLTDCQARDAQKLDFHFNASLTALNLAKWRLISSAIPLDRLFFPSPLTNVANTICTCLEIYYNFDLNETFIKSTPTIRTFVTMGF